MDTSRNTHSPLRSAHLIVLLAIGTGAIGLRSTGMLLHQSGVTLAADVLITFGLLLPASAFSQLWTSLRDAAPPRSGLSRASWIVLDISWTLVCASAIQLGLQAPRGVTWLSALFDPSLPAAGLTTLCAAAAVLAIGLVLGAIDALALSRKRAAGLTTLHRFALRLQACVICISAPLLFLASLLALLERTLGLGIWTAGSSLTLHVGWFALQPLLLSSLLPMWALMADALDVTQPRSVRAVQVALWLYAALSVCSAAQNAYAAGISELDTVVTSFFAVLGSISLLTIPAVAVVSVAQPPMGPPRLLAERMGLLSLLLTALFFLLSTTAALPVLSLGLDLTLFGWLGRTLLLLVLILGAVQAAIARAASRDTSEAHAVFSSRPPPWNPREAAAPAS